ncbi:MAG: hypothetical protein BWY79_00648 [Actinobacteria bacterium ADurb.Bin444]|nr:MAG: hypothetical protein BWY79_00648 [Actinobacteria bacterium ADurb.Bin444]
MTQFHSLCSQGLILSQLVMMRYAAAAMAVTINNSGLVATSPRIAVSAIFTPLIAVLRAVIPLATWEATSSEAIRVPTVPAMARIAVVSAGWSATNWPIFSTIGPMNSINPLSAGIRALPMLMATSDTLFLRMLIWEAVVSTRRAASSFRALFSSQAVAASPCASVNTSVAPEALSRASRTRISPSCRLSSIGRTFWPSPCISPRPVMNALMAPAASVSNLALNSSADMPATAAKFVRDSPPLWAAEYISSITLENAVPPASAAMPTEERAPAKPSVCASVMPMVDPAPASRRAISTISPSVVARLLPSATTVAPRFENSVWGIWVMLASRARDVAASVEDMLVDMPSLTIVSLKDRRFSFWMPSCPAASMTAAISVALWGSTLVISMMPSERAAYSASVAFTVLRTPAKALS